ncbi:TPA: hypothetical protein ACMFQU_006061 [Pseudomonas aeruginosa]|nr:MULTISPECIES: hypothetical protein [Pseudomonas]AYZ78364.1 hypothetical protein EGY23_18910 [Pseudomonas aeruginosa]EIU2607341.1 hypothetical protein [Pseudomonas aeruginosa]EIU2848039.1 hypothetical protein [Pseudomonas aeruginosa]EIU4415423.1 hypothetical protein [Pseudomonas aeruginosa]EIU7144551.1 hypothetical protein [Pseudomonas aeruginosa]
MKLKSLAMAVPLALAGCDFVNDQKLNFAHQEYMQECFATFSNSCNDKAIDYNIMLLEVIKGKMIAAGPERLDLKGESAERFEEHVEKSIGKMVETFEVMRPGFFTRVFMGGFEPFDGKSVRIIEASDADELFSAILEEYTKRLLENRKKLQEVWEQAPNMVSEAPKPVESLKEEPVQSASQDVEANGLKVAVDAAIIEHAQQNAASEYGEARRYLQVDFDGNGSTDAVVMYTLEPINGGNYSNQYLVPLIHNGDAWEAKTRLDIMNSASDLADEGNGVLSYVELSHGPDDADCCPSMETKRLYKWNGSILQEYKSDGVVPTQASSKPLAEPPFYSVLTLNDSSDEKEVTTKRVLECSMASKLVGQLASIDIIADKINQTGLANAINPNPEIMADYHQMIKKDWSLKDMNRASQDEYLVGIYNSEFCHKLHEQPAIQVSDVPAD